MKRILLVWLLAIALPVVGETLIAPVVVAPKLIGGNAVTTDSAPGHTGDVLESNGTSWAPGTPSTVTITGGTNISVASGVVSAPNVVVGPASATDSNFSAFNATTGKLIKDSGKNAASFDAAGAASAVTTTTIGAVPTSRTVCGHSLTGNVACSASDVGAPSGSGTSSGTNTGDQNLFGSVAVSGQSSVVATSTASTLTLAAGSNVTLTTDAGTQTVTIAASGSGGGGTTTNPVTFNNAGSGASSGTTFDGSIARTISYNTLGAVPTATTVAGHALTGNVTVSCGDLTDSASGCSTAAYSLPTASTSVLGGVKVDGTTVTITDGVISAPSGGSGDVVGPASAVDSNFAAFNATTGKLIKDSGKNAASFDAAGAALAVQAVSVPYSGATSDINISTHSITSSGGFLGNASSATNIAGGASGQAVIQTGSGTTGFLDYSSDPATASTLVKRDANNNIYTNNFISGSLSTVTSASTIQLTEASAALQILTGTSTQLIKMPNATTLDVGWQIDINNNSTSATTVQDFGGTQINGLIGAGNNALYILLNNSTSAGTWDVHFSMPNLATGVLTDAGGVLGFTASPTLTGTNITGVPVSTGISGLGTGVATWLATPSFSNLNSALSGDSVVGLAANQTITGNKTYTGTTDSSGATHTTPSKTGVAASKPATCTVGEEYFATDATAGQNKYYCTATNTWTQQTGGAPTQTWAVKTTTYTAVNNDALFADTNGGAFTITLPAGIANNTIWIADYRGTFGTNNLTISPNGTDKINGVNASITAGVNWENMKFIYVDSTVGWRIWQ